MAQMARETQELVQLFYQKKSDKQRLTHFVPCPEGYHFIRDVARPNKVIALPCAQNFPRYACIAFDLSKHTGKAYMIEPTSESGLKLEGRLENLFYRQVIAVRGVMIVLETLRINFEESNNDSRQKDMFLLTRIQGNRFVDHVNMDSDDWIPVINFKLACSLEYVAIVGGSDTNSLKATSLI